MQVEQILANKDSDTTVTIKSNAKIKTALSLLNQHSIGAIIVTGTPGTVEGILSERDIVRALATIGLDCLSRPVSEVMTTEVKTCTLSDQTDTLLNKMTKGRFRHLPVMKNGSLCGIVSIGDVVKARLTEIERENQALTDIITTA